MNTNPINLSELVERYISYRQALGERFINNAFILRAFARSMGPQSTIGDVRADQVSAFLAGAGSLTNTWHIKYGVLRDSTTLRKRAVMWTTFRCLTNFPSVDRRWSPTSTLTKSCGAYSTQLAATSAE